MKWTKPNGTVIKTNDMEATVECCISLGWKEQKVKPAVEPERSCPEPLAGEEPVVRRRGKSVLRPTVRTNEKES